VWLKDRLDRQKSIQDWYENRYLLQGLEPLVQELREIEMGLTMGGRAPTQEQRASVVLLTHRVSEVLQSDSLYRLVRMALHHAGMFESKGSQDDLRMATSLLGNTARTVYSLKRILLPKRLRQKADIFSLHEDSDVTTILGELKRGEEMYEQALTAGQQANAAAAASPHR
jgi:hypothetical protein